jgi:hypothetical protein
MRHILCIVCVIGCAATGAAQEPAPSPFVVADIQVASENRAGGGRSTTLGFETTIGGPSWRGLQLFGQGGRIFDVKPSFDKLPTLWYGAAGVRLTPRSLWRFRPYADTSTGIARMGMTMPLVGAALGVQVDLGKRVTVDVGHRVQRFFGDVNTTRGHNYLGLGVTF